MIKLKTKENHTLERPNYFGLLRSQRSLAMTSGFTRLVKHFRSNPLTALLRSRMSRFSQTKFRNCVAHSYGFTLAEVLVTLAILGLVAAMTVPTLLRNQTESINRAKVKKAMAMYEKALNNMIIENDLRSTDAIKTFGGLPDNAVANTNNCVDTVKYFKTVEGANYRFKTADGVWWDITDITNPIIILDSKILNENDDLEELQGLAQGANKFVYGMVGRYEDDKGILRINDNAYEDQHGSTAQKAEVAKLWDFINNQTAGGNNPFAACDDIEIGGTCEVNGDIYTKVSFTSGCINLAHPNDESCPVKTGSNYVTIREDLGETNWITAINSCPSGTHLAKMSELVQMWDNGAEGNTLESLCDRCNESYFWSSDEYKHGDMDYAYDFSTADDGEILNDSKDEDYSGRAVCVGN